MESITLRNYQSCLRPRRNLPSPPSSHAGMPTTDTEEDDGPFFDLDLTKPTQAKFPSALGRARSTKLRVLVLGHRRPKPTGDASQKQQEQQKPEEGEKGFGREVVSNYMVSKIKPLYVRVSKLRLSPGQIRSTKTKPSVEAGLARNRAAVAPAAAGPAPQRRDDSLVEQQDGIRRAIAHCKRSFNVAAGGGDH